MTPSFSPAALASLETAARVLLSPLAAPDPDAWRTEVAGTVRQLLGADHAVFGVAGLDRPYVCDGIDEATWGRYAAYVTPGADGWGADDPVVGLWLRAHQAAGGGVFDEAVMDAALRPYGLALRDSDLLNAVAWPNGMFGMRGLTAAAGGLQLTYDRPPPTDDLALAHLGALLPSFRAGLDALARLGGHRAALAAELDALSDPAAAFDADGRPLHRNTALVRALDADPGRGLVEGALFRTALRLRQFGFARRHEPAGTVPAPLSVDTARGRWTLQGTFVADGALGPHAGFLVLVRPPFADVGAAEGRPL